MSEHKNCPFCGGKPEVKSITYRGNDYNPYIEVVTIKCTSCETQIKEMNKPVFRDCSNYKVQDFRDNPNLRAEVQLIQESKTNEVISKLWGTWNTRAEN